MTRTRKSTETSTASELADDAGGSADAATAAKRPCTDTWRVRTGGYVGGSLPTDYEHLDFQAHGIHVTTYGVGGRSEQDFAINAKAIDAGNDESLSPQAREFYAGADLRLVLWTVREGWDVFQDEDDEDDETEVQVELGEGGAMVGEGDAMAIVPPAAPPAPPPRHPEKEWLRRRDFVQVLGFSPKHFGHVQWIELPSPDDIDDDEVSRLASTKIKEGVVNDVDFRYYHNHIWTARARQTAAARVRTLYVADRLAGMGVSLSAEGDISFGPGVLGETFRNFADGRSVVVPSVVFAHFAEQSQFIHTAAAKWETIGLAAPMAPFPFGGDGPEREAFSTPAPEWYVPVMTFAFQDHLERASRVVPRVDALTPSMFSGA